MYTLLEQIENIYNYKRWRIDLRIDLKRWWRNSRFIQLIQNSRVPQGGILAPPVYILFTADILTTPNSYMGTFVDVTVILC